LELIRTKTDSFNKWVELEYEFYESKKNKIVNLLKDLSTKICDKKNEIFKGYDIKLVEDINNKYKITNL
jgi:hypothetical protein